jgi:hypothetical protein
VRRRWRRWQPVRDVRQCVFLDECGVTTDLLRRYGRSLRGTRLHDHTPWSHWHTHTVVAALRLDGLTKGVSPKSVLVIAGVRVGDAFSRTQRGGAGSDRAVDAGGRGAVSSVALSARGGRGGSFSVIDPRWPEECKGEYSLLATLRI